MSVLLDQWRAEQEAKLSPLERTIRDLVKRKRGASAAERAMLDRCLNGLRYTHEEAGGIWESIDTDWDATPP